MTLPPGQRAVEGLPRFGVGVDHPPPAVPDGLQLEVTGPLTRRVALAPAELADLPRRDVRADLHCVAGWSGVGLHWSGVAFAELYGLLIEPALAPWARVRFCTFVGLDGYRSILTLDDALAHDVLLADRLDGEPLTPDHGAPVRLVSPRQYGYLSTKHLCRIELTGREPVGYYHPTPAVQRALLVVRPHRRARVAQEERHRFLPGRLARLIYRLVPLPAAPLQEDPLSSRRAESL